MAPVAKQGYFSDLIRNGLLLLFSVNDKGFKIMSLLLVFFDAFATYFIIQKVPYTEIDWSTYMQQVECYTKKRVFNYSMIEGDTGPVVYPAGHLITYNLLYNLTNKGKSIRVGQYIFMGLYLINLLFIFKILYKTKKIPPFVLPLVCCTGYRIHSIFVLRLFNDPIAMLLFYIALDRFLSHQWMMGSILFSLAVSIKMNVILFAPAMFFTLLFNTGLMWTIFYIGVCGFIQLFVGLPFLLHDPVSYLKRSFDLGRVFMFKWTVNWRFLPEEIFLDKRLHMTLLVGHATLLVIFAWHMWFRSKGGMKISILTLWHGIRTRTGKSETVFTFFTANLIGIAFSRSLHYQFYSWYYHQLPFLLFVNYPNVTEPKEIPWKSIIFKIPILLLVELCWNIYPSTWWSSALLHVVHAIILIHLIRTREVRPPPRYYYKQEQDQDSTLEIDEDEGFSDGILSERNKGRMKWAKQFTDEDRIWDEPDPTKIPKKKMDNERVKKLIQRVQSGNVRLKREKEHYDAEAEKVMKEMEGKEE